ncbi:MAG: hypothetical protein F6K48_26305 [Okeania sp. SIO3H1]|uniref:hypothetical protein n=1 Tax=Okeania sp. SIO1I7 TaxID=2607772 RepID=UPI0013CD9B66|nr:hypothetical protein [Okeania sp. SIO1I7]NEN92224.1 hypothetical protein [Okeania sp. SIO3H1]NET27435.1 hypothetical protein [Okeania sp. SIO1I7]
MPSCRFCGGEKSGTENYNVLVLPSCRFCGGEKSGTENYNVLVFQSNNYYMIFTKMVF